MPSNSTASHERAYKFMNDALELRILFTIIARLTKDPPDHLSNDKADPELEYIARQGERLAQKLNVNPDNFSMDLSRRKLLEVLRQIEKRGDLGRAEELHHG